MGILRFLLAISVIIAHTTLLSGLGLVGGQLAVESFFIISGFYITLILNEKYVNGNDSYWLFMSNRLLRLLPIYWTVLVLTIMCAILIPNFRGHEMGGLSAYYAYWNKLNPYTWAYLIFTNVTVFFHDTSVLMGVNIHSGGLFYTHNFLNTYPELYRFFVIPQAWSVGLELMFYIVAPLILRRRLWIIIGIMLISFTVKIYYSFQGFNNDPWTYRFFPFELAYFLAGSLSYYIYARYVKVKKIPRIISATVLLLIIVGTVFFSQINFRNAYNFYLIFVSLSIPVLFKFTKDIKVDRYLGELSYPIYISHILIRNLVLIRGAYWHLSILTVIGSVIFSALLLKLLGDRIEKFRQARVRADKVIVKNADAICEIQLIE